MSKVLVREAATRSDWRVLFNLPSRLYREDPNYVEPLRAELRNQFNPAKNSFFNHGDQQP